MEMLTIPGAPLGAENPLPFFRDPQVNQDVAVDESLPAEKRRYLGWETGFRVLPYRMQDEYTRQREPLQFRSIVLENEFLTATFLPELGGRLISLVYRPLKRELLHRNPVFQPANLAIRNAWFSGGIEWNCGQYGHAFSTCAPLFASATNGVQGEPGLRMYEFERCKGLFWQIDFTLPAGSPFLVAYTRVVNPNPRETGLYWWTNVAVNEAADVRVLAPAAEAIYIDFTDKGPVFGTTQLPGLPSLRGVDGTYALHSSFANEFFFQCDGERMPWEAALDGQGRGFIEASTRPLAYRKMFCWGSHTGGRHWQEFLSQPGQAYLEIQAGLAPSQLHGLPMAANSSLDWTQVFGYVEADPDRVHGQDWNAACQTVTAALTAHLSPEQMDNLFRAGRSRADQPSDQILQNGSGWGALELTRRAKSGTEQTVPAAFVFLAETLGPEQQKWLGLLEQGSFPDQNPADLPGDWLIQPEWQQLLEASLQSSARRTWLGWLHLGVMRMETFDEAGAEAAWQESLRIKPSGWAYRNLAILRLRQKQNGGALELYEAAWRTAARPTGLTIEYLKALVDAGQFARARDVFCALPAEAREADRVQVLYGQIAMAMNDLEAVETVLQREFAIIREGEIVLSELWFELKARQLAAQTGQVLDAALRLRAKTLNPPPARIDFRMTGEQ